MILENFLRVVRYDKRRILLFYIRSVNVFKTMLAVKRECQAKSPVEIMGSK